MKRGQGAGTHQQNDNMAEGGSKWWDTWLQTAKDKGSSVLEFMKKDLDEFTTTVQQETSTFVSTTTASLKEKLKIDDNETTANAVKRSVSGLLNTVSNALVLPKEHNEDDAIVIRNSEPVMLNRLELQLHLMQQDASTYLEGPSNPEDFKEWLASFDLDSKQKELTELMATRAEVRSLYCKMVPSQVSHAIFWQRYFYNVHCILKAEEQRLALKQRADKTTDGDTDLAWDEDEDIGHPTLTALETDCILDDYQRECEEMEARANRAVTSTTEGESRPHPQQNQGEQSLASEIEAANARSETGQETVTSRVGDVNTERSKLPSTSQKRSSVDRPAPELVRHPSQSPSETSSALLASETEDHTAASERTTTEDRTKDAAPDSSLSSKGSEGSLLDDEWEKDFDVGVADEDVQRILKQGKATNLNPDDEDWENWH